MTFIPGQTLAAAELNPLIPPNGQLLGGTGTTFTIVSPGAGLALGGGALTADYQGGTLTGFGTGLTLTLGLLEPDWQAGSIVALGSGVSAAGGTLTATGSGGSVTSVGSGAGLTGGPITGSGTLSFAAIAAASLLANSAGGSAVPSGVPIGSGLAFSGGTLTATGSGGSVTSVVAGAGLNGGTITTAGTLTANYQAGTLTGFGTGLTLSAGSLASNYQAGSLTTFHSGLTLAAGTLTPDWNGGSVAALGLGVGLNSGTIAVKSQVTMNATAGATIAIAPTGAQTNYMVNGPAAGGTVTLTGSFTPGQAIVVNVSNGATATSFVLGAGFQFSTSLTSYTSTAVANKRDIIAAICNVGTVADVSAINQGFSP